MDAITTLATVPAVIALVNLLKYTFNINGRYSALLAVIIGVGLNIANYALGDAGWYQAAAQGLILALGASGIYDVSTAPNSAPSDEVISLGLTPQDEITSD